MREVRKISLPRTRVTKGKGKGPEPLLGPPLPMVFTLDPRFGSRMRGEGIFADHIAQLFEIGSRRAGIQKGSFPKLSTSAFRRAAEGQASLFD